MARKRRFTLPGMPQHIIQRGHNREPFFCSESDYERYLANLHKATGNNIVARHAKFWRHNT